MSGGDEAISDAQWVNHGQVISIKTILSAARLRVAVRREIPSVLSDGRG